MTTTAEESFVVWSRPSAWRGSSICRRWQRRATQPTKPVAELIARDILILESGEVLVLAEGLHPAEIEVAK
jgi:hypothetical protein